MAASDATSQRRDAADDVRSEPAGTATEAEPAGVETTGEPMSDAVTGPERSSAGSAADLETRAIPSLDPELTESVDRDGLEGPRADAPGRRDRDGGHATAAAAEPTQDHDSGVDEPPVQSHSEPAPQTEDDTEETDAVSETDSAVEDESETPGENAERLRAELEQHRERIDRLESELARMETERDDARAKLATVQEERDELQERVDQLEAELGRLEEELGAATDAQRRITPQEALDGTDLFVRYHSKGDGTLEKAHDSGIRREEFTENLRLEKHTQFETAGAAVNGQTYDEFLEDTVEYKFVRWVVRDLLFEIQSTGHTETLADLYDALPKINRVELNGAVSATDEDNNETTETFDVVFRARMGDPLLVANINDSRQGATEGMMENLITAAERVGKSTDDFAAAFLVTQSFFEPPALEAVAGATRGGLLSRDKRKSFVNLSRKQGYHLCLVEARNENFHLEVPEL
jgi:predicted nuclease with TOPRIM domain